MRTSATSAHTPGETRRVRRRATTVFVERSILFVAWVLGISLILILFLHYRTNSEQMIRDRMVARNSLTAQFISDWASKTSRLQRRLAEIQLSGKSPTARDLKVDGDIVNSDAAVLLDSSGKVLVTLPVSNRLVGTRIDHRYEHMRTALGGKSASSDVVLSVVKREPVVMVAVPFDTPYGRRVFNAGFKVRGKELKSLVTNKIVTPNSNFELIDSSGISIVGSGPDLSKRLGREISGSTGPNSKSATGFVGDDFYALTPVPDTGWTLAMMIPKSSLYSSLAPRWLLWAITGLFALVLGLVALLFDSVLSSRRRQRFLADHDSLTQLPNRSFTTTHLSQSLSELKPNEDLSILLIDVDRFKQINDKYGHVAGDEVLASLASRMQNSLRPGDLIGRWGGEEFLAVLADTDVAVAESVGQRLRATIESDPVVFKDLVLDVSVSVGCVQAGTESLDELVDRADVAMYEAKRAGRNNVVAA